MKKPGTAAALLTPDAQGWRLVHGGNAHSAATLEEALSTLPAQTPLHLALPAPMALLERLTLPSTDRGELEGMVQLQLEKTVPYPVEEVSSDFEILHQEESEATVLATSVHIPSLEQLCAPLKARQRLPEKITVFAQHVATIAPATEHILALWGEQGQLAIAICEKGKMVWTQTLPGLDAEMLGEELPRVLLSAEMEGVSADFSRILLADDQAGLEPVLRELFQTPVELFPLAEGLREPAINLVPRSWHAEMRRFRNTERLRQRLTLVAMVYLVLVAAAFLYLAWMKRRVQQLDMALAQMQPQVESVQAIQSRWRALTPAIDPHFYPVELLYLVDKNRPSPEIRITQFDYSQSRDSRWQFTVDGEAPNATQAVEYTSKLQKTQELEAFEVSRARDHTFLPDGRVQFSIIGKL